MEPLVETVIEDTRWEGFGLAAGAERAAVATMAALGLPVAGFTISLLGCDDSRIAVLNADFRGKATATNVLSWPSEDLSGGPPGVLPTKPLPGDSDDPWCLGDIALAWDTCEAEALAQGKPMGDHVTHLIVHGTLHLLGYDHQHEADADLMETTERRILASIGVADPY